MQDVNNEFELRAGNEIVQVDSKKFVYQNREKQPGEPTYATCNFEGYQESSSLGFILTACESNISNITLEIDNYKTIQSPVGLNDGEILKYTGDNKAKVYDANWNLIKTIDILRDDFETDKGEHAINFSCEFEGDKGEVKIELRTEK